MKRKLYLIRGVSGSGKSTLAEELYSAFTSAGLKCKQIAADEYFHVDGEYRFDREKLHLAHKWCYEYIEQCMKQGDYTCIFIHNTFTTTKEIRPYINLAKLYDFEVTSIVLENRHGSTSIHDVPQETLERQRKRLVSNILV